MDRLTNEEIELLIVLVQNEHDSEKDNVEIDESYLAKLEMVYEKLNRSK